MNRYENLIFNFSKKYQKQKKYPATVICASFGSYILIDKSGAVPKLLAPQLQSKLSSLGTIDERCCGGNYLGRCAEVRASNDIFKYNPNISTKRVSFSNAYRPRTMQIIPTCYNCQRTF